MAKLATQDNDKCCRVKCTLNLEVVSVAFVDACSYLLLLLPYCICNVQSWLQELSLVTRTIVKRKCVPWFNGDIRLAIRVRRTAERKWRKS